MKRPMMLLLAATLALPLAGTAMAATPTPTTRARQEVTTNARSWRGHRAELRARRHRRLRRARMAMHRRLHRAHMALHRRLHRRHLRHLRNTGRA
ncbi:MAG TPA: hypothetical protein VMS88_04535 [Terriglobales bacterium]|nr:hypothetical protein [Terriglobales bacterium]